MQRAMLGAMIAAWVAGCAATDGETPADRAIAAWVGHPVAAVIAAWGPPTEETSDADGHIYVWRASHYDRRFYPANLAGDGHFPYAPVREEIACQGVFDVDDAGTVTTAEWRGRECHDLP